MSFIIVYITFPNMKEARRVCNFLMNNRSIACANYFSIRASSIWTGKVAELNEVVAIVKTKKENWNKVKKEVVRLHSYKVPCIMKINVEANKSYEDWIRKETR